MSLKFVFLYKTRSKPASEKILLLYLSNIVMVSLLFHVVLLSSYCCYTYKDMSELFLWLPLIADIKMLDHFHPGQMCLKFSPQKRDQALSDSVLNYHLKVNCYKVSFAGMFEEFCNFHTWMQLTMFRHDEIARELIHGQWQNPQKVSKRAAVCKIKYNQTERGDIDDGILRW